MSTLVLKATSTEQWHQLVHEAQQRLSLRLDEQLESYLVFMLMRFTERPDLAHSVLSLEFLRATQAHGGSQREGLREVGDQCLLYAGLFPRRAERRLVRIGYFVALGRAAYQQLSDGMAAASAGLYACLSQTFVALMDVLQTMRAMDGRPVMEPVHAAELWTDTGSRQSRLCLAAVTDGFPVRIDTRRVH